MKAFGGRGIRRREGGWLEGEEEREIWHGGVFELGAKEELRNEAGVGRNSSRWGNS